MPTHPVDVHVGKRLRMFRSACNMSQEVLGVAVGVTFQQIQKYEKGSNRVGASRLYQFAKVLNVDISSFFEGFRAKTDMCHLDDDNAEFEYNHASDEDEKRLELAYAFRRIDQALQPKILAFLKSLANMNNKNLQQGKHTSLKFREYKEDGNHDTKKSWTN